MLSKEATRLYLGATPRRKTPMMLRLSVNVAARMIATSRSSIVTYAADIAAQYAADAMCD
jgi:hypothetical protein